MMSTTTTAATAAPGQYLDSSGARIELEGAGPGGSFRVWALDDEGRRTTHLDVLGAFPLFPAEVLGGVGVCTGCGAVCGIDGGGHPAAHSTPSGEPCERHGVDGQLVSVDAARIRGREAAERDIGLHKNPFLDHGEHSKSLAALADAWHEGWKSDGGTVGAESLGYSAAERSAHRWTNPHGREANKKPAGVERRRKAWDRGWMMYATTDWTAADGKAPDAFACGRAEGQTEGRTGDRGVNPEHDDGVVAFHQWAAGCTVGLAESAAPDQGAASEDESASAAPAEWAGMDRNARVKHIRDVDNLAELAALDADPSTASKRGGKSTAQLEVEKQRDYLEDCWKLAAAGSVKKLEAKLAGSRLQKRPGVVAAGDRLLVRMRAGETITSAPEVPDVKPPPTNERDPLLGTLANWAASAFTVLGETIGGLREAVHLDDVPDLPTITFEHTDIDTRTHSGEALITSGTPLKLGGSLWIGGAPGDTGLSGSHGYHSGTLTEIKLIRAGDGSVKLTSTPFGVFCKDLIITREVIGGPWIVTGRRVHVRVGSPPRFLREVVQKIDAVSAALKSDFERLLAGAERLAATAYGLQCADGSTLYPSDAPYTAAGAEGARAQRDGVPAPESPHGFSWRLDLEPLGVGSEEAAHRFHLAQGWLTGHVYASEHPEWSPAPPVRPPGFTDQERMCIGWVFAGHPKLAAGVTAVEWPGPDDAAIAASYNLEDLGGPGGDLEAYRRELEEAVARAEANTDADEPRQATCHRCGHTVDVEEGKLADHRKGGQGLKRCAAGGEEPRVKAPVRYSSGAGIGTVSVGGVAVAHIVKVDGDNHELRDILGAVVGEYGTLSEAISEAGKLKPLSELITAAQEKPGRDPMTGEMTTAFANGRLAVVSGNQPTADDNPYPESEPLERAHWEQGRVFGEETIKAAADSGVLAGGPELTPAAKDPAFTDAERQDVAATLDVERRAIRWVLDGRPALSRGQESPPASLDDVSRYDGDLEQDVSSYQLELAEASGEEADATLAAEFAALMPAGGPSDEERHAISWALDEGMVLAAGNVREPATDAEVKRYDLAHLPEDLEEYRRLVADLENDERTADEIDAMHPEAAPDPEPEDLDEQILGAGLPEALAMIAETDDVGALSSAIAFGLRPEVIEAAHARRAVLESEGSGLSGVARHVEGLSEAVRAASKALGGPLELPQGVARQPAPAPLVVQLHLDGDRVSAEVWDGGKLIEIRAEVQVPAGYRLTLVKSEPDPTPTPTPAGGILDLIERAKAGGYHISITASTDAP